MQAYNELMKAHTKKSTVSLSLYRLVSGQFDAINKLMDSLQNNN
jgi:hypothetical protein